MGPFTVCPDALTEEQLYAWYEQLPPERQAALPHEPVPGNCPFAAYTPCDYVATSECDAGCEYWRGGE